MVSTAKVFKNGSSQAIRLPMEYRFECSEVYIEKKGDMVILRPKLNNLADWLEGFYQQYEALPEDFMQDRGDAPAQERVWSDD